MVPYISGHIGWHCVTDMSIIVLCFFRTSWQSLESIVYFVHVPDAQILSVNTG